MQQCLEEQMQSETNECRTLSVHDYIGVFWGIGFGAVQMLSALMLDVDGQKKEQLQKQYIKIKRKN